MKLSAQILDEYDRCERRYAFLKTYEPKLISTLGVLYAAVEAGIVSSEPEASAKDETMKQASSKDLVLKDLNSFASIRHIGYLAGIISVALQSRLGRMKPCRGTDEWESGLFESEDGSLHRIELVSHFDDDRLRACAHSWRVIGELAALQQPVNLTVVVIGPQRGGRRHSEWSKGLLHPVNKKLRFSPRNNKQNGFAGSWEKVWREQQDIPTKKWLEQMNQDGIMQNLIVSREIAYNPDDSRMVEARVDMIQIADRMSYARTDSPMRRSSCDEFGGCAFQSVCYSPKRATPSMFPNLYQVRKDKPAKEPA
ncbi:MAG: hypothetical protein KGL39_43745 [Patescibacteria group bacterium]|nr:hypothetical protein [Patescibacteria group bacterium]